MDEPTTRADAGRANNPATASLDGVRPTLGGNIEVAGPRWFATVADDTEPASRHLACVRAATPRCPGPADTAAPSDPGLSATTTNEVSRSCAGDGEPGRVVEAGPAAGQPTDPRSAGPGGLTIAGAGQPTSRPAAPAIPGYEIIEELGRGGMGVVYKARQIRLNRPCALKMILAGAHANPQAVARFLSEAQAIARLHHAQIVQIYSIGEVDGLPYAELEYLPGGSLDRQLQGTPWRSDRAARLVERSARGIAEAHRLGIVHRDLKPANVLMSADGTPKISDFGLAKFLGSDSGPTGSEAIMGSPSYMAPEQAEGKAREVGPAADVYAMGAILYELLTGRPPFRGATILETLEQVKTAEPVPPSRLVPRLPRDIETICLKCLQKEPSKRYGDAEALAEDLRRFGANEPIVARPIGGVERAWRWCRRNKTVAALAAVIVLAMLLGTTVSTYFAVRANQERELSEYRLYLAEMNAARQAWQEGRISLVEQYLQAHEPKRPGERDRRGFEWYYLQRLCQLDLRTMRAHAGGTICVVYSPDGRTLASGGRDNSVKLWDAATGQEIRTLSRHTRPVQGVAFSPDGLILASASLDMTVKLWEVATGREVRTLRGHAGEIWGVTYSPDGRHLASASLDRTIRLWDAATGQEIRTLRGPIEGINSVAYGPGGRTLASAGRDNAVKLWDPATGREIRTLQGHTAPVTCVVFSPDGLILASGGEDRTVRFWDVATGHEARGLLNHPDAVRAVSYGPDGRTLASAGDDNIVRVWDTTGREKLTLRGHAGRVQGVSYSRDGRTIASASGDNSMKVWDANSNLEVVSLRGPLLCRPGPSSTENDRRIFVAFGPGGRVLASSGYTLGSSGLAGRLTLWDAVTGREMWTSLVHDRFYSLAFTRDGRSLAFKGGWPGFGERIVTRYDVTTGREIHDPTGRVLQARDLVVPPSFQYRIIDGDRNLVVRDSETDREVITLRGHSGRYSLDAAAVSPDGRFAGAEAAGAVKLWDTIAGQEILTLRGDSHVIGHLAFSPDGRSLASASGDGTVNVWDATPLTPELRVIREARSVVAFLLARSLPAAEALACIRRDPTISEPVRQQALALAEQHERSLRLRDAVAVEEEAERVEEEAKRSVDALIGRLMLRSKVLEHLRTDSTISEPVRRKAIAQAKSISDEDEAKRVVRVMFEKFMLRSDVLGHLRTDPTLSEPVREKAMAQAESTPENALMMNNSSWRVVRAPGDRVTAYERALRLAESACRTDPNDGLYLNTLGVAQYRMGKYREALETLTSSEWLNSGMLSGSHPADLAFLAMARYRLGQTAQARATMGRLREALKKPAWAAEAGEAQAFLREAEALELGVPPADPSAP